MQQKIVQEWSGYDSKRICQDVVRDVLLPRRRPARSLTTCLSSSSSNSDSPPPVSHTSVTLPSGYSGLLRRCHEDTTLSNTNNAGLDPTTRNSCMFALVLQVRPILVFMCLQFCYGFIIFMSLQWLLTYFYAIFYVIIFLIKIYVDIFHISEQVCTATPYP